LEKKTTSFLLFVKDGMNTDAGKKENVQLQQIVAFAKQQQLPFYLITNAREVIGQFNSVAKDSVSSFLCDAVAIKTAARANPTLYQLKDGNIVHKWAFADFDKANALITGKH